MHSQLTILIFMFIILASGSTSVEINLHLTSQCQGWHTVRIFNSSHAAGFAAPYGHERI